jgi:hypothetical protein
MIKRAVSFTYTAKAADVRKLFMCVYVGLKNCFTRLGFEGLQYSSLDESFVFLLHLMKMISFHVFSVLCTI